MTKRLKRTILVVIFFIILVSFFLLLTPNFFKPCNVGQQPLSLTCSVWNFSRKIIIDNRVTVVVTLFIEILVGFIFYFMGGIKDDLLQRPSRAEDFEFDQFRASELSEKASDFPELNIPYIQRQDKKLAETLFDLENRNPIILVGKSGSGKTREAIEIINRIDAQTETALIFWPRKKTLEEISKWPNMPFGQNKGILFLDNLNDFELKDGVEPSGYSLEKTKKEFENTLSKIVGQFQKQFRNFRIIATIGSDTKAWQILKKTPLSDFQVIELPDHTRDEAIEYCKAITTNIFTNIELDISSRSYLANNYDGTFTSIQIYLKSKNNLRIAEQISLKLEDVKDFRGVYQEGWEQLYKEHIEKDIAAKSIFEALSVISQARIVPYKKLIVTLAVKLIPGWHLRWWKEHQVREVLKKILPSRAIPYEKLFVTFVAKLVPSWPLRRWKEYQVGESLKKISPWVSLNEDILNTPKAYISGRGKLDAVLDEICEAVLFCSDDDTYKYRILPDLVNFSEKLSHTFDNNQLALKLANRAHEIDPRNVHILHTLAITYDKLDNNKKSIELCRKALEIDSEYKAIYSTLGVSLNKGNGKSKTEALKVFEQGIALFSDAPSILIPFSILLDRSRDPSNRKRAIGYLKTALKSEPENITALKSLAIAYQRDGRSDESVKYIRKAFILQPDNESIYETIFRLIPDLSENSKNEILNTVLDASKKNNEDIWTYKELCKFLWQIGREKDARVQLDKIYSLESNGNFSADEYWELGELLYSLEEYRSAIPYFKQALEKDNTHYKALSGLGQVYRLIDNNQKAIEYFEIASKVNPYGYSAWAGLGSMYLRTGRFSEAEAVLVKAISLKKNIYFAWIVLSKIPSLSEPKIKSFLRDLSFAQDNPRTLIAISIIQRKLGMLKQAEESANKARKFVEEENDPLLWLKLAETTKELELYDETLAAYLEVIKLMPNNALVHSYLSSIYLKLDRFSEASISAKKAVALGMEGKSIFATQGDIEIQLENYSEAYRLFTKAINLDQYFGYAWSGLGQALGNLGKYDKAFDAFQNAINYGHRDPNTWNGLGMAAKSLGRPEIAKDAFLASIELNENHYMSWSHLGEIYLDLGEMEESVNAYTKSIKIYEKNAKAWGGLGHALNQMKRYEEAIEPHRKAIALGEANFANYFGLGKALHRSGEIEQAIDPYVESIKLKPDSLALYALIEIQKKLLRDKDSEDNKVILYKLSEILKDQNIQAEEDQDIVERAETALRLIEYGSEVDRLNAVKILDQILLAQPNNPKTYNILSSAFRHLKQFQKSIDVAKLGIEKNPSFSSAWYTIGRAYEESNNLSDAKDAFEEALRLNPDYKKAKEHLDELNKVSKKK